MILVVGSTGFLGSAIASSLAGSGKQVRALVRPGSDSAKVDALRSSGIEIVEGDLTKRATLDAACKGVATVVSTANSMSSQDPADTIEAVDQDGNQSLIAAAEAANVQHFVFVSVAGTKPGTGVPFLEAKANAEEAIRKANFTHTILQPTFFAEAWLSPALGFDVPNGKVRVYGTGDNAISYVSLADVASVASWAVSDAAARGATIAFGGPDAVSPNELVKKAEAITGKSIAVERVPVEALMEGFKGATDSKQKTFAGLGLAIAQGAAVPMDELKSKYEGELTPLDAVTRSLWS